MDSPIKKQRVKSQHTTTTYVDKDTGEVVGSETKIDNIDLVTSKEEFFFTYRSILKVREGTTPLEGLLLQTMCFESSFNTGLVHVSPALRTKWCKQLGCSKQSLSNALSALKKKSLIVSENPEDGRGTYLINPVYFFKGDQKSRGDAFELMMKIKTNVKRDDIAENINDIQK